MARKRAERRAYPTLSAYLADHPEESQGQIAQEFGISQASLSMIKWGLRQPQLPMALAMAKRFNIPLESLIRKRTA